VRGGATMSHFDTTTQQKYLRNLVAVFENQGANLELRMFQAFPNVVGAVQGRSVRD